MTPNTLQYSDDRDKAYGVAGMTITLVALDGEDYFSGIDLDAPAGEHIIMSHDYGFRGNPRMSAKVVWEQIMRELRITASLALGNLMPMSTSIWIMTRPTASLRAVASMPTAYSVIKAL